MKILHIGNPGNGSGILAKYQIRKGYEAKVYLPTYVEDPFNFRDIDNIYFVGPRLIERVLRDVPKFDIIHIHAVDWMIPFIRKKHGNKVKIIMHHHGQHLRGHTEEAMTNALQADLELYSTPDLKMYMSPKLKFAYYLPNPIDPEHFKAPDPDLGKGHLWVHCYERYDPSPILERFPEATIWKRWLTPLSYAAIPRKWAQYKTLIEYKYPDVEYDKMGDEIVLSRTAMEFLVMNRGVYYFPWSRVIDRNSVVNGKSVLWLHTPEECFNALEMYMQKAGLI